LPLASTLFFALPFLLTTFSLEQQLRENFLQAGQKHVRILKKHIQTNESDGDHLTHLLFGPEFGYYRLEKTTGEAIDQQLVHKRTERWGQRKVTKLGLKNVDGIRIDEANFNGRTYYEFSTWFADRRLVIGFCTKNLDKFILQQKITIAVITIIALAAMIVAIMLISTALSKPVSELVDSVEKLAKDTSKNFKLPFLNHADEVGVISRTIDNLVQQLNHQQEQLSKQKVGAELDKVTGQVVHDMKGPLSSMSVIVDHAREKKISLPDEYQNLLEMCFNRFEKLIDSLLEKKQNKPSQKLFSLYPILDELVGEFNERYKNISFCKKYTDRAVELLGSDTNLQRLFANIMKNAAESIDGSGKICVSAKLEKDQHVIVGITDSGCGMTSQQVEKLLGGQLESSKEAGHGIGTNVIKDIVREFGAELKVDSNPGQGSTFIVKLPRPSEEYLARLAKTNAYAGVLPLKVSCEEPLLVIEDDKTVQAQWKLIMEKYGVNVELRDSLEELQAKPVQTRYAVVDYSFGKSSYTGKDVVDYLKKQGAEFVYLCTADYWKPSMKQLVLDTEIGLIPKPLPRLRVLVADNEQKVAKEA